MRNQDLIIAALISGAATLVYRAADPQMNAAAQKVSTPYQTLTSHLSNLVTQDVQGATQYLTAPELVITACRAQPETWWDAVGTAIEAAAQRDPSIGHIAQQVLGNVPEEFKFLIRLPGRPVKRP